jgi:hypothetical protein
MARNVNSRKQLSGEPMKPSPTTPAISYSFIMRLSYPNRIGMFARIVNPIGKHGGNLGAVDIVTPDAKLMSGGRWRVCWREASSGRARLGPASCRSSVS